MDPRLRDAVAESAGWYDDVFAGHGLRAERRDGLWVALDPPPPYHSAVKTLRPGVPVEAVLAAAPPGGTVADSFGDLPLADHGYEPFIAARWFHHPGSVAEWPDGWSVVRDPATLAVWNEAHDYAGVLLPAFLDDPRFVVLAGPGGGCVLHDGPGQPVGLSNWWGTATWPEVVAAAGAARPGRALVGFTDEDIPAGAADLGPQVVWRR